MAVTVLCLLQSNAQLFCPARLSRKPVHEFTLRAPGVFELISCVGKLYKMMPDSTGLHDLSSSFRDSLHCLMEKKSQTLSSFTCRLIEKIANPSVEFM